MPFLALLLLAACSAGPVATPAPSRLRISGSTTLTPALRELASAFQAANPNVLVEVQGGDTANGWLDLRAGRAEIAALSYSDESQPAPEGFGLLPVARDAIAVIVHPRNPITNVTALQLRALFAGEVLDWTGLGGVTGEPVIVSREDGSGTRTAFEARVMGGQRVTLNAIVMPTTEAVVDYVASHRLAVGYVSASAINQDVRAVPVEGLVPDIDGAVTGGYYLMRTLYLAARDPAVGDVRAFLEFAQGTEGAHILSRHFVSMQ